MRHSMRTELTRLTALAVVALSAVVFPGNATADTWNERTELTFTQPVMIPGATLPPGTYTFKLADTDGSRHLVQVFEGELDEIVALTQAVPVRRQQPTGETILTFNPSDSGVPALKAWYYPNSAYGHEFIYPEKEAQRIAERSTPPSEGTPPRCLDRVRTTAARSFWVARNGLESAG